ncbi:MAG: energy transducer TonB [Lentisphaeraceae bacterium]|nr:energy transducer TonB [Lentisphaeraceae bacterium]
MDNTTEKEMLTYSASSDCVNIKHLFIALGVTFAFYSCFPFFQKSEHELPVNMEIQELTPVSLSEEAPEDLEEIYEEAPAETVTESQPVDQVLEVVELDLKPLKANTDDLKLELTPSLKPAKMLVSTKSVDLDFAMEPSLPTPVKSVENTSLTVAKGGMTKPSKLSHANKTFHEYQVDQTARRTSNKSPKYPLIAKRRGISGKVVIDCIVSTVGKVTNYTIVESRPKGVFEKNCLAVLDDLRYKPAMKDGQFVAQRTLLTFEFGIR